MQTIPVVDGSTDERIGSISVRGDAGARQLAALGFHSVDELTPRDQLTLVDPKTTPAYTFTKHGSTGIIRVPSSDVDRPEIRAQLEQLVRDAPIHRDCSELVVDLRGNGGGSIEYVMQWARALKQSGSSLPPLPVRAGFASARQGAISGWNAAVDSYYFDPQLTQNEQSEVLKEAASEWPLTDAGREPELTQPDGTTGTGPSTWPGTMSVLVDRRTASGGEVDALLLREWFDAKIVGERSAGNIQGLGLVGYQLPATGLLIGVPMHRAVWDDPRIQETAGIPIDIALRHPGMPAEQIVDLIRTPGA